MNREKNGFIELHAHLDGAITADIARELADITGVRMPMSDSELSQSLTVSDDCGSLADFLNAFELPLRLLQTPEAIALAVRRVSESMARCGVLYAELRFAPQLHTRCGMSQEDAVTAALHGLRMCDIPTNLILCMMRGADNAAANEETLAIAERYAVLDGGVVGIDLAGDEAAYPTRDFEPILSRAASLGIPLTVHAGEAGSGADIAAAMRAGCRRIGHGVRIDGHSKLICEAIERGITFELCPTSNRVTGAVPDMAEYPMHRLMDAGARVALCTDDPAILGTTLCSEFSYAESCLSINIEDRRSLIRCAIDGAFTSDLRKDALRLKLNV